MAFSKKPPAKTALVYAVDLLAARPYSTKQLYDKLVRHGYTSEETDEAMSRLLARHYLDDADLCRRQCAMYLSEARRSVQAIKYKLREKGFDNEDIESSIETSFDESGTDTAAYEYDVCLRLLRGHFRPSSAEKQKCLAYLYRKGFSSSAIRAAVEDFMAECAGSGE